MEFSEVKEYIDTIKDSERFKKLDEFTRMTRIKKDKDIYENIIYYVSTYQPQQNTNEFFQPDYAYFMKFLEQYLANEPATMHLQNGYVDLMNTLYLSQPRLFSGHAGNFLDKYMIMTDGSIYISKLPLNYRGNSGVTNAYCLYCPLIASYIAKHLDIECADVTLAKAHNGYRRILSKNFLRDNEEIVTYTDDEALISEHLNKMDEALRIRRFPENDIEKAEFEFIKQEFVSKLIGLKDQKADNSPLIVSTDEDGHRHVRMSPMFDLDYSFHIAKDMNMLVRKCDNGHTDIGSLIKQYIDYPGFKEFAQKSIDILDMKEIFRHVYEDTGIKAFEEYSNDDEMKKFVEFVDGNIQMAKETFSKLLQSERGER